MAGAGTWYPGTLAVASVPVTWYLGLCPSYFEIHQVPGTVCTGIPSGSFLWRGTCGLAKNCIFVAVVYTY